MGKLLDLIREQQRLRGGGVIVILVRNFCCPDLVPNMRVGDTLLEMAPDEPFETFEARAVAAAKVSGANFVAIQIPDELSNMTDAQLAEFRVPA
jgi:hypothetical protein